jgi:hypothetical protein
LPASLIESATILVEIIALSAAGNQVSERRAEHEHQEAAPGRLGGDVILSDPWRCVCHITQLKQFLFNCQMFFTIASGLH